MFGCLDVWMFGRAVFSGTTVRELVMVCHLNHRTPNRYTLLRPGTKDSNVACIKCQKSKRCLAVGGGDVQVFECLGFCTKCLEFCQRGATRQAPSPKSARYDAALPEVHTQVRAAASITPPALPLPCLTRAAPHRLASRSATTRTFAGDSTRRR